MRVSSRYGRETGHIEEWEERIEEYKNTKQNKERGRYEDKKSGRKI